MAATYICTVTRMRVRHPLVLPRFYWDTVASAGAARATEGVVKVRLLGFPLSPWYLTLSVWESPEAMRGFVKSPAHRVAMSHLAAFAAKADFATFTSDTPRVGWRSALCALKTPTGVWTRAEGMRRAATPAANDGEVTSPVAKAA